MRKIIVVIFTIALLAIPATASASPGSKARKFMRNNSQYVNTLAYRPFTTMSGHIVQPNELRKPRWKFVTVRNYTATFIVNVTYIGGGQESAVLDTTVRVSLFGKPHFLSVE